MSHKKILKKITNIIALAAILATFCAPAVALAAPTDCGEDGHGGPVKVTIDIGCSGKGNPIADMTFAIIRFLSDGVGLVIIGSIIVGGIPYSASRGDPSATANAIHRIQATVIALIIYIFSYAILNFLIPAGFLK